MGSGLGKIHDAKRKQAIHDNNCYPQRPRRSTVDGAAPHFLDDVANKTNNHNIDDEEPGYDARFVKNIRNSGTYNESTHKGFSRKEHKNSAKNGFETWNGKPAKKRGSKLNYFLSLKRGKGPPVPHPLALPPKETSFEVESEQLSSGYPTLTEDSKGYDESSVTSKHLSFSEEYEEMCSSVSSAELGRDTFRDISSSAEVGRDIFRDHDSDTHAYHEAVMKVRARGRSVSDSLYHLNAEGAKDTTIAELQRASESERRKNRRFEELNKILAQRNVIIEMHELHFGKRVGEGAFSEVWEGQWRGVQVAIKKLKSMVDDELFKERFLREVENLRKGNHQNVVMFFGVCISPPCIVTEYMAGGNLYDLLHRSSARLSNALVTKMATDLAVGLHHLHSLSILHRDLTSLNILLDEMGNVKISDFGLSREKKQEGSMTMTLGGICNPRWRPPEITKNLAHYSEKVDVYSFALVVWEMLTGEIPFSNLDGPQAAAQVAYTNLRPPIPPTCPAPLSGLLQRCWVDDAKSRPDFTDIVEELKAIQFSNPMGFASELH